MPRSYRQKSITKVYHLILRGINKQDIFLETSDYYKFLTDLKETKEKYEYKIYAYVLMNNHIHLLLYVPQDNLSKIMQSLTIRYSLFFNKKYERYGHLFQNRFISKNIENMPYLLNVQRYIHQNPEHGKISKIEQYKWSSYKEYVSSNNKLVDTEFILSIFHKDKKMAIRLFENFHSYKMKENDSKYEIKIKYTDEEAIQLIKEELKIKNLIEIQNYNKKLRDEMIKQIGKIEGLYYTQIARILSLNRKIIERAIQNTNE